MPKGRIVNEGRGIITHNDRLILDVSRQFSIGKDHKEIKLSHKVLNSIQLPRCYSTTETVAVLAFLGGNNLFHWITEGLPKLAILRKSSPIDINAIDKFVVNKGFPAIQESLEMLGIHNSKLIFIDSECHIKAEKLIVPSFPGSTGDPPGWVCNFLRESLLKHRKPITPISNRLYISRAKAKHRKVVNEENVIHYLEGMGFKTIFLEDHDLATQISLFSNAEAVVAPHGAGLTNLMWCSPRTKVLEFFSPNYVNVCFWAIANQINLDYFYLVGDGKWPPDYIDPHIMSDDISVSIEKLSETLELMHLS
ncbi:MAG: glycosyltransferase family 61 protein [Cyanobacteria bacterium J06581_3]